MLIFFIRNNKENMALTIGCHLSASNGFLAMGKTALSLGANTFAFFTRNPQGGKAKEINEEDAKALVEFLKENNFAVCSFLRNS